MRHEPRTLPRRRVSAVIAGAALTVGTLAGCGNSGNLAGSSGGVTTITVQQQAGDANVATIQSAVKLFEAANPDIKVNIQIITVDTKNTTNANVLSSANPPDVGVVPTNSPSYSQLVKNHKLLSLQSVWSAEDLKSRYGSALASALTAPDGNNYVVSVDSVYYSIAYYNPKLFQQAGISVPADHRITSANQLYSMVGALKKIGKQGLGLGGKSGYAASWMLDALLPTSASTAQVNNYLTSWQSAVPETAKYTDPAFTNAVQQLSDFNAHGVYQDGFLAADTPAVEAAFESGDLGMTIDGSWEAASFRKVMGDNLGWLLLPPVNATAKTQITAFAGDGMGIPANAKHPAQAEKFLEFYMSEQNMAASVIKAGGNLAPVFMPSSAYSGLDPLVQQMLADGKANGVQSGWTSTVPGTLGQSFFDPLIQSMYAGQASVAGISAKLQAQLATTRAGN
ncbi:MAG TPA: extracellular solute-binding protein [Actinospica sp.]|jgi:ABC-type glycerol-3-phosphate transport system substrate-binding protein|nr:extracellular solute-binding protein [Actinospica sp.]